MGFNTFAEWSTNPLCFIVLNITSNPEKTLSIFTYPVPHFCTRDLLRIPGVAESDIRSSLLKGQLRNLIIRQQITVICSDIDLLQFSDVNKAFLESAGITKGLEVSGGGASIPYSFRQNQSLDGIVDGTNRTFTLPNSDKAVIGEYYGNIFDFFLTHNGKKMEPHHDYILSESGGPGSGFDTITCISNPILPGRSVLRANYVIAAI
jgi:hypothetical protein